MRSKGEHGGEEHSYEGVSFEWVLCGMAALTDLDNVDLGRRFLDCVEEEDEP
jgi:hypothetical protein